MIVCKSLTHDALAENLPVKTDISMHKLTHHSFAKKAVHKQASAPTRSVVSCCCWCSRRAPDLATTTTEQSIPTSTKRDGRAATESCCCLCCWCCWKTAGLRRVVQTRHGCWRRRTLLTGREIERGEGKMPASNFCGRIEMKR